MSEEGLFWIDLESTGLKPRLSKVLEIGLVRTDLDLLVTDTCFVTIWGPDYHIWVRRERVDDYVWKMHTANGLLEEARSSGYMPHRAKATLLAWLDHYKDEIDETTPLCGSSLGFDRNMMDYHFSGVLDRFSYRNIDISSLKELVRKYRPEVYPTIPEKIRNRHRVMPDIRDTLDEFRFYQDLFGLKVEYEV
jgi:oligoribonuclease